MEIKAIFDITVTPKSSRSEVKVEEGGLIKIYLNSPPVDGKANSECINVISKKLKIAKSNISIDKGDHGRKKRISVNGLSIDEVIKRFRGES